MKMVHCMVMLPNVWGTCMRVLVLPIWNYFTLARELFGIVEVTRISAQLFTLKEF